MNDSGTVLAWVVCSLSALYCAFVLGHWIARHELVTRDEPVSR